MLHFLVPVAVALLLSGCAGLNIKRAVTDEDLGRTKRIAVVSLLGDTFQGVYIGSTVFDNRRFMAPVPEWGVDTFASERALSLLGANKRFESLPMDRMGMTAQDVRADGGQRLLDAAQKQGFDKVMLIRPARSDNNAFFAPGFGVFENTVLNRSVRCVYAAYLVEIHDVGTRKPIAWEWGGDSPCVPRYDTPVSTKRAFDDYSADEKQAMRTMLETRLGLSLRYALAKLRLLPEAN